MGTYSYPASGSAHPHAVSSITSATGTITYTYDLNGNMTGRGGLLTTWDAENRPLTISTTSGSESYAYDADGERVKVVAGSTTTVYLGGLWEETSAGARKLYYTFNGQVVAMRDSVTYLHSDHLGSVSASSDGSGGTISRQWERDALEKCLACGDSGWNGRRGRRARGVIRPEQAERHQTLAGFDGDAVLSRALYNGRHPTEETSEQLQVVRSAAQGRRQAS